MSLPARVPPRDRLVFALDVPDLDEAARWVTLLAGSVGVFKVGLELFVRSGSDAVALVRAAGARCFLDLKLHDIPATVGRAVAAAAAHQVDYLTVHASGGAAMLAAAVASARAAAHPPALLAVTVLTSLDEPALHSVGVGGPLASQVDRLAQLSAHAGVAGVVCSPHEIAAVRRAAPALTIVTPGVRPARTIADDQARVATPAAAVRAGADLLVVGRPIRDARDPAAAARDILAEIAGAT